MCGKVMLLLSLRAVQMPQIRRAAVRAKDEARARTRVANKMVLQTLRSK